MATQSLSPKTGFLLLAPSILVLALLTVVPSVGLVVMALFDWSEGQPPAFVGLGNIAGLAADPSYRNAVAVSGTFVALASGLELGLGLMVAVSLEYWPRLRTPLLALFSLPLLVSGVLAGITWRLALAEPTGWYTGLLSGLVGQDVRPLSSPWGALLTIVAVDVWQWTPFVALLLSVSLQAVRRRVGDLVAADHLSMPTALGAVLVPLMLPAVAAASLLRIVDCLRVFDIVQSATAGGPGGSSEVLPLYAYKQMVKFGNFGAASAIAVTLLVASSVVYLFARRVFRTRSGLA